MAKIDERPLARLTRSAIAGDRSRAPGNARPRWSREVVAGLVACTATLAVVLTLGLLAFAPLGHGAASAGVTAAFVSASMGGLVFALLGRSAMPVGGTSSAVALIYAALLAQLVSDPRVSLADRGSVEAIVAVASATVLLMGAIQVAFGVLGLGRLAKFVPQPVLAGFMNGVAVLIVLSQLPSLLGVPASELANGALLQQARPFALALGLGTAALTWLVANRRPRWPAPLLGLAAGIGLYAALKALDPTLALGEAIGPLPEALPAADLVERLVRPDIASFAWRHAGDVLTSALILALISSLESVLGVLAINQQLNARPNAGSELAALGLANIVAGFFGGLPMVLLRARALATIRAGGKGWRAALAGAILFGALYLLGGPALELLPKPVLAGIMLTIAVGLMDRWTHQLVAQLRAGERSVDARQSLLVIAVVCGVTVWKGFVVGVAVGVLASLVVFIRAMNRSLVRARFSAVARPSRRIYAPEQEQLLAQARKRIEVRELEGALFFGSADRLSDEAEALDPQCRCLLLDLRRVSTIDESGAVLLQQLSRRLRERGIALRMAGVTTANAHGRRLRAFGCFRESPRDDWFADVDYATEAAERELLREAGIERVDVRVPLQSSTLFRELEPRHVEVVQAQMARICLQPGEQLFRQNDAADRLYVLTRGSVSIVADADGAGQRFASFSPGVMFGETAMLDRGGRSASAAADDEAEVYVLTEAALERVVEAEPAVGALLYRNIAVHLSDRLRRATALHSTEGR